MEPQTASDATKLAREISKKARTLQNVRTVICPPHIFLKKLERVTDKAWCSLGAQDVFWEDRGAHTGEISPFMLKDAGVKYVIVGHSERRLLGETNEIVNKKLRTVLSHGLEAIVCVGEQERDEEGEYLHFVEGEIQESLAKLSKDAMRSVIIAYEPIWAVGKKASRADTPEELFEMVIFIRKTLNKLFGKEVARSTRVIYGGSVNENNAKGFLSEGKAGGLLVGRASLDAKKFGTILEIADRV